MKKPASPRPAMGVALFHHPNSWIDDMLHGDHTHTDEDGNEVTSPGTPDRPVVIEPTPIPILGRPPRLTPTRNRMPGRGAIA